MSESTGIERRLRLLLDAAYAVNPNVHLAFLVEPHLSHAARDALREQARQNLAAMLGGPVTVTLIPLAPAVRNPTGLLRQLVGAASLYRQASIAPFVDAAPLASLASLLADAAPEFVIAQRLTCAAMLLRLDPAALPPVFFDLDDVEHVSHARAIRRPPYWRSKSLQYLHLPALMLGERRAIRLSRRAFVCSAADRERVRRDLAVDNVDVVPNAIVPPPRYVPPPAQPHLLFVGTYGYAPNRDAAEHLIDDIWPRIRARLPTATLTLAGAQSHLLKHARATPAGVVIAGFVTD
ncbi:MAG: glycosyltransferase family 4 protein, partial [Gammaproteobacteria bacterium]